MLRVLRSWEIILVCFSERRNPFWAHRGVQALTPLQPGGTRPWLWPLLSPCRILERIPSEGNPGTSSSLMESLWHIQHSLMFSPSAWPQLCWRGGKQRWDLPAEDAPDAKALSARLCAPWMALGEPHPPPLPMGVVPSP